MQPPSSRPGSASTPQPLCARQSRPNAASASPPKHGPVPTCDGPVNSPSPQRVEVSETDGTHATNFRSRSALLGGPSVISEPGDDQ